MKKYIVALVVMVSFLSCENKQKEYEAMKSKVDSLSHQLDVSQEAEEKLNEVGVLIDSIEASRKALQIRLIEGSSYADYVGRLREINTYVQRTEAKLSLLEKSSAKSSKTSKASIRRMKADLAKRSEEIVSLQLQLAEARNKNMAVWVKANQKDSILSMRDQVIKLNEDDIASLEKLITDTQVENKVAVANLYYNQASALETVAKRTQFAPRKKKAAREEALELYKLSLSLGKSEAQVRIIELEKQLS